MCSTAIVSRAAPLSACGKSLLSLQRPPTMWTRWAYKAHSYVWTISFPFAPFSAKKQLAEGLVLSKLDYNDAVFNPLTMYLIKRLQRVLVKLAHKAIHRENWPEYLPLQQHIPARPLRSSGDMQLSIPLVSGTQQVCAKAFNDLPTSIRNCSDYLTNSRQRRGDYILIVHRSCWLRGLRSDSNRNNAIHSKQLLRGEKYMLSLWKKSLWEK